MWPLKDATISEVHPSCIGTAYIYHIVYTIGVTQVIHEACSAAIMSAHTCSVQAQKAAESFSQCCGFDVEEFVIDLYYWFDKSTKRKNGLYSYCNFCDQEYRDIVKHVSTRWLSLERAVERSLKQLPSLTSYFKSESESQARFLRLQKLFSSPMTEVYLLFIQSMLPSFTHCNEFLQREEPLIHVLQPQLTRMLKIILGKFVKPGVIRKCMKAGGLQA